MSLLLLILVNGCLVPLLESQVIMSLLLLVLVNGCLVPPLECQVIMAPTAS